MLPRRLLVLFALLSFSSIASAQQDFSAIEVEAVQVSGNVYMLTGSGGNIGLSIGEDGAFLIDDQYAPLTTKINAAVSALTDAPARFLVNTHWHGDHTGGNENFGTAGTLIVAHENVRKRMSTDQFMAAFDSEVPASPEDAWPVVTFTDAVTFYWNGDEIRVQHLASAHTDGDAVIHFVGADVIHTGDTVFNGFYPFIDVSSGGSVSGLIDAVEMILAMAGPDTKIIPGHGPLATPADLETYHAVLKSAHERVSALLKDGQTRQQVVDARPMSEFDEAWGGGFMNSETWIGIVYDSIAAEAASDGHMH